MINLADNKAIKFIIKLIKFILIAILACVAFIIIIQRVSNNTISIGGIRIFNVISGSMLPKYEKGDILVVQKVDASKLKVGHDLVYSGEKGQVNGKIITHQITQIEETSEGRVFHTKGIANDVEDPLVKEDQVFGRVVHRMVILSLFNKLMYNEYIFYFVMIVPIGIIIFLEIKDRKEKFE